MVDVSAALRTLAGALMKIANDVRWYACGSRAGFAELRLPENERLRRAQGAIASCLTRRIPAAMDPGA